VALWLALLVMGAGCSELSRYGNRRDSLQEEVKRFHLALLMNDTASLLRQVPSDDRPEWAEALPCLFGKYRLVDYSIQEIKTGPKVRDARVVVWVTRHPVDSLVTQEAVWVEQWLYRDKRWFLDAASVSTRKYLGDCLSPLAGDAVEGPP